MSALEIHRIRNRLEQVDDMRGNAHERVLMGEGDERRLARGEELASPRPVDGVAKGYTSGRELAHPATHPHQVVVAGSGPVADAHLGDGEVDALLLELFICQPGLAHQLGPRPVEPDKIVGVDRADARDWAD